MQNAKVMHALTVVEAAFTSASPIFWLSKSGYYPLGQGLWRHKATGGPLEPWDIHRVIYERMGGWQRTVVNSMNPTWTYWYLCRKRTHLKWKTRWNHEPECKSRLNPTWSCHASFFFALPGDAFAATYLGAAQSAARQQWSGKTRSCTHVSGVWHSRFTHMLHEYLWSLSPKKWHPCLRTKTCKSYT